MTKLVDARGNEFKVGCVFGIVGDNYKREVVKITDKGLYFLNVEGGWLSSEWYEKELLADKARILHYRELAPDKHGKMLCEGDTVKAGYFKEINTVLTFIDKFLLSTTNGGARWDSPKEVEFVSRPTDDPKADEKKALQQKIVELEAKVAELKAQAERM
jgi:hypothetical protein